MVFHDLDREHPDLAEKTHPEIEESPFGWDVSSLVWRLKAKVLFEEVACNRGMDFDCLLI
jgi:hypothetical protein